MRLPVLVVAVAVLAVVAAAPATWVRASYGAQLTGDEPHYLLTAISLAEDRDLDVSDEHLEERWRSFHEVDLRSQAARQPDGRMVVPHDPLLPLLLAVPWLLAGWVGAKLALVTMLGGLAGLLLWTAVRRFGAPAIPAAVVVAVMTAAAPLTVYGTQVYPEVPAALALLAGVAAGLGSPRPRTAVAVVAAVVALPWLAVKFVPVAAALVAAVGWRWWRLGARRLVATCAGLLLVAGVTYALAHLAWYGGLTTYAAGGFFQEHGGQLSVVGTRPNLPGRARRIVGLLIDDEFGLAAWQPAYLLAVPALAAFVRRRPDAGVVAAPLVTGWLVATFVALTMHGWWFPGRQVVVVLPLAVLALAWWVGDHRGRLAAAAALGVVGVATSALLAAEGLQGRLTWVVDFAATANPWYRTFKWALPDYLDVTAWTWVRQSAWMLALGTAAVATWRRAAAEPRSVSP